VNTLSKLLRVGYGYQTEIFRAPNLPMSFQYMERKLYQFKPGKTGPWDLMMGYYQGQSSFDNENLKPCARNPRYLPSLGPSKDIVHILTIAQ